MGLWMHSPHCKHAQRWENWRPGPRRRTAWQRRWTPSSQMETGFGRKQVGLDQQTPEAPARRIARNVCTAVSLRAAPIMFASRTRSSSLPLQPNPKPFLDSHIDSPYFFACFEENSASNLRRLNHSLPPLLWSI